VEQRQDPHQREEALVLALEDGCIAGRYSDTGEKINAGNWFRVTFVGPEPLLGAGRRVDLRRADLEKLWPDPTAVRGCGKAAASATPEKEPLRPAAKSEIHRAIGEAYDAAAVSDDKPPNLKEIAAPVQAILCERGYQASGNQIQQFARDPCYAGRRRKAGATLASEWRKQKPQH
jgi:hypothetical protein